MKLWRVKQGTNSDLFWTYAITNNKGTRLSLESNEGVAFGVDDLSTLIEIGRNLDYIGGIDEYELIVENFNSIEELKALVPEEFI